MGDELLRELLAVQPPAMRHRCNDSGTSNTSVGKPRLDELVIERPKDRAFITTSPPLFILFQSRTKLADPLSVNARQIRSGFAKSAPKLPIALKSRTNAYDPANEQMGSS